MGRFEETLLGKKEFVITCELIPGRGHSGKSIENILKFVEGIKSCPDVQALSLTDNAGGNPALTADVLGKEILTMGMDIIVHFSCKDMNRNFVESRAFALQRTGVTNLLVVTGDYPIGGFLGLAKPVFDIDSVNALNYLAHMNDGLEVEGAKGANVCLDNTMFFLGAAVSPFKWTEGPCVMQYIKMEKKIRAGAHYFITQLGYDARKHVELLRYTREVLKSDVPLIGSVYVLTSGAADFMSKGEVPGSYVPVALAEAIKAESKSPDKGKAARIDRAAKHLAYLKGLGYSGAHIEGLNLKAEDIVQIIARAKELEGSWREVMAEFNYAPPDPFYFFEGGETLTVPAAGDATPVRQTKRPSMRNPNFWLMRGIHKGFFYENTPGYAMMGGLSRWLDKRKAIKKGFMRVEHFSKRVLLGCRYCDDCAIFETFYVCPESNCPKGMRIGPCGGSRANERCEVYPDKYCYWRNVYIRAKNRREVGKLD
ncbi:MAG: methylenetetrahydrofolate reductase C-terminal domain-containing protein, partial [Spirochaetota bacterium]